MVVVLYLRGRKGIVQTELLLYKGARKLFPLDFRVSQVMGIEVPCGPSELGGTRNVVQ